ncbi:FAD-dependent oxidoreductase [Kribbella italica]|uniref:Salicylate hydroxylase n=1 Tax=Kribbella italica TaxID=1540520 RepID=A0A7W9JAS3_9ACTN|nr:NAD(P)/FAD-dependent oxidoreductase [Kribbella italica]MBB5838300.1 salicylate hydroxylase [Kribbella italica]
MSEPQPSTTSVDLAVIGAGIGGLATAVALRHAGLDPHVFERTPVLSEVGGAVVIRDPSVRLLEEWGLQAFHDEAVPVDVLEMRDVTGQVVRTSPADLAGDGQAYSTHRHDVHDLLAGAVGSDRIHLGAAAESVANEPDGEHATITFSDGSRVTARLVVGADGIRSVARRVVVDDAPVFDGIIALRGTAPASALPDGAGADRITVWSDGAQMILGLPLRGGTEIALDTIVSQDLPPEDLWHAEVSRADLLMRFSDFDPGLRHLIASGSPSVRANPVYDREPITQWARGRVVLVGDAAHPMAPRQGQGANQAIQDAGALATALGEFGLDRLEHAVDAYHQERVATATTLQRASRTAPEFRDATASERPGLR